MRPKSALDHADQRSGEKHWNIENIELSRRETYDTLAADRIHVYRVSASVRLLELCDKMVDVIRIVRLGLTCQ